MHEFLFGFYVGFTAGLALWLLALDPILVIWLEHADALIRKAIEALWRRL